MRASRPVVTVLSVLVAVAFVAGLPLVVAVRLGRSSAVVFGVPWLFGLLLLAVSAGTAWRRIRSLPRGSVGDPDPDPGAVSIAARDAVERSLTVVVPLVVVLLVASPWVLTPFGAHVRDTGIGTLLVVALAGVPAAVVVAATRAATVLGRTVTALVLPVTVLVLAGLFAWGSAKYFGGLGAGTGWLLAQSGAAVVVFAWFRRNVTRSVTAGA